MIKQLTADDFGEFKTICLIQNDEANLPESNNGSLPVYLQKIRQVLISNTDNVFVIWENNKIIGYTIGTINEIPWNQNRYGDIGMFFVHPEHRNKKNADALYKAIVNWFKENNCVYVMASVFIFKDNCEPDLDYIERASGYFELQGMRHCGNFFVKGIDE